MTLSVGCGDAGESEGGQQAVPRAANEPPETFVRRVAKLLATTKSKKDCAQLEVALARSRVSFPCPPGRRLRESMASFKVKGAEEHGIGAVVDYRSGSIDDNAAILLFTTRDSTWGIGHFGVITKPSVDTSDSKSRADYENAVTAYLRAIRTRDCAAFKRVAFVNLNQPAKVCSTLFRATGGMAKLLAQNRDAKPIYQGGNSTYGFYSFETTEPRRANRAIIVVEAAPNAKAPARVMTIALSATAADRREARTRLQEQQENNTQPETSPSKKVGG